MAAIAAISAWGAPGRFGALAVRGAAGTQAVHRAVLVSRVSVGTVVTTANYQPKATSLPGGATLVHLINGLAGWAVLFALAGLLIGAAVWALGSHSQNYQQSYMGRRAVLVSGLAALLIGAAPTLINFFFSTGSGFVNPL